jgi:hypothetical protein
MLFHYTVTFRPDDDELFADQMNEYGFVVEKGLVAAAGYGAAADRLSEYFGQENIVDMALYECYNPLCYDEIADFLK